MHDLSTRRTQSEVCRCSIAGATMLVLFHPPQPKRCSHPNTNTVCVVARECSHTRTELALVKQLKHSHSNPPTRSTRTPQHPHSLSLPPSLSVVGLSLLHSSPTLHSLPSLSLTPFPHSTSLHSLSHSTLTHSLPPHSLTHSLHTHSPVVPSPQSQLCTTPSTTPLSPSIHVRAQTLSAPGRAHDFE